VVAGNTVSADVKNVARAGEYLPGPCRFPSPDL